MKAIVVALLLVLGLAAPTTAQVYRWTDDDGVIHLTTDASRIPAAQRDKVDVLEASPRETVESPRSAGSVRAAPGSAIFADAHLNGVPLTLLVDTGAERTVIAPAVLARAGFDLTQGRQVQLRGVTGTARAVEIVVQRFDIAGAQIGPLGIVAHDIPGLGADGLLGRDVLEQFVLTVDPVRGKATLSR